MPTPEGIIELAERLARRERFDPSWITYPRWAGSAPEFAPMLAKADKFKTWAKAILEKELPPPAWLAEEDGSFRDPELNKPSKNPNNLTKAEIRRIERTRFACRLELQMPLPSLRALPKPKRKPTRDEIIDLAMRLDDSHFSEYIYRYPVWASYPPEYAPALEIAANLKRQAEAILNGEARPPPWLVHKEPDRWTPQQEVRTAPAPASVAAAAACLQRRTYPMLAAWILLATAPSPSPPARPPPLPVRRRTPYRIDGDARPVLPPVWEQETRTAWRDLPLWQLNSGLFIGRMPGSNPAAAA